MREQAQRLQQEGNFREALALFQRLTLESERGDDQAIADDVQDAVACTTQLGESGALDDYLHRVASRYPQSWRVLGAVGREILNLPHYGHVIGGAFHRGDHRGQAEYAESAERDRVWALQQFDHAVRLVRPNERTDPGAVELLDQMALALLAGREGNLAWRLQTLTSLDALPDVEVGWHAPSESTGAPVNGDGAPILYGLPSDWESSANDGERWRSVLATRTRWAPHAAARELLERARFQDSQFGVVTLASIDRFPVGRSDVQGPEATGLFALHTLEESETIARLAIGVRRFDLGAEFHHLALWSRAAETAPRESDERRQALTQLAQTFENRRQFARAAEYWKGLAEEFPQAPEFMRRYQQIVGAWGRFEPSTTQAAGRGATIEFRYRNAKRVEFTARTINVQALLDDVKAYIKSRPAQLDWEQLQIENIGHRLVVQGQEKYLLKETANWQLDLQPTPEHFDRRTTVATPLQKGGAYLVSAKVDSGNVQQIVLWVADSALVKKNRERTSLYFAADAATGKPLAKLNIEFFGFQQRRADGQRFQIETRNFAEATGADGMVEIEVEEEMRGAQWIAVASSGKAAGEVERFAYLGYSGLWAGPAHDLPYRQVKSLALTDRPVYRPSQKVQFKFWIRAAQYDLPDESRFAAHAFQVEIRDPRNERVYSQTLTADGFGGLSGSWEIPDGATLGSYRLNVVNHGGGTFRVEEYKKPEFEVQIETPDKPVALGDRLRAVIRAKYYFGEPVTQGKVRYQVYRTTRRDRWFPLLPWDWLYGAGYGFYGESYDWYPGWQRWGCPRPRPWWIWRGAERPELVASQEVALGPDGSVEVTIDTSLAHQLHPNDDHQYRIEAEVVDASRRSVVASGDVVAAREPFQITVWTDRGYYRSGDTMQINLAARTPNGNPVQGQGILRLLRIAYRDDKPVETLAAKWELPTDADGDAQLQITATEPGQYRLAYELTLATNGDDDPPQKVQVEGAQVIAIRGPDFDGRDFRFNALELTPDRRDYAPGDKVALQVSSNQIGASVLLFVRPVNGRYPKPQLVRLDGKTQIVELDVKPDDAPNFFVEGVVVHGGQAHTVVREIYVPPASRILNVEVVPSAVAYLPGQRAELQLKLTDAEGRPFVGSTVVAVYDKALDAISGEVGPPDIREFFWKWQRQHMPSLETNLGRHEWPPIRLGEPQMESLGIFGDSIPDEQAGYGGYGGGAGGYGEAAGGYGADPRILRRGLANDVDGMAPMAAAMADGALQKGSSHGDAPKQPAIRRNFADTALWIAALETNRDGMATAAWKMPENLTAWRVRVWAMGHGTRVGQGSTEIVTRKDLIVRLQTPRFVVDHDELTLSANVHNLLESSQRTVVRLEWDGDLLELVPRSARSDDETENELEQTIEIPAGGEIRVDWRVRVRGEGKVTIRASASAPNASDAIQLDLPALVHGIAKTDSYSGSLRPTDLQGQFTVAVPEARRPEESRLEVRYTPTLAGALVDAIPYLIEYPYGCTEQTLNRFLPAVLAQHTLERLGIDLAAIRAKSTNLNSQQTGDAAERAAQWKRYDRNPVFSEDELAKVVKLGVNRLTEMQLSDGGWGWFSGWGERSSAHTTSVVVHGLEIARQNEVALVPGMLERGAAWLVQYQATQLAELDNWDRDGGKRRQEGKPAKSRADELDALVLMVLSEQGRFNGPMRDYLYQDRTHLAPYSLATFGLALHYEASLESARIDAENATDGGVSQRVPSDGASSEDPTMPNKDKAIEMRTMVLRNLSQFLQQDDENQTAWLDLPSNSWWRWYGSEFEAHAYFLKLLTAVDPHDPSASRLVKYLLNNRLHATRWNSTRDTALVVEAMADYMKATGEDKPQLQVQVLVDGALQKEVAITPANLFAFDNQLVLEGAELATGSHVIELRKTGNGPLYYSGYMTNFTLEDPIAATGLEIKVERRYYKLKRRSDAKTPVAGGQGQALQQQVEKWDRTELADDAQVASGDLVEVELVIDSKNDYEYIVLEDAKPAGYEPVEVRSGYNGNALGAYVEYRDERVALFVQRLARGRHSVSYRLRGEIPGRFSALPTRVSAMYAPELKANSAEFKAVVVEGAN